MCIEFHMAGRMFHLNSMGEISEIGHKNLNTIWKEATKYMYPILYVLSYVFLFFYII